MRHYMSKKQRPCDFCRSRKSGCRIEGQPPCRLCRLHGRDCTFLEAAQPRKKPTLPPGSPDRHNNAPSFANSADQALPNAPLSTHALQPVFASDGASAVDIHLVPPTTQFQPVIPPFSDVGMDFQYDLAMDGSEYQFLFRPPHSPSSEISAIGSSFGVIPAQSVSPQPTGPGGGSRHGALSDDWKVANAENLGLSGDMDPYLLQRYKADIAGVFKFKQLAIHAVQETPVPIQFLVSQPSLFSQSREETGHVPASQEELRFELEQIVSIEMGHRLIDLFDRFVAPQYPIFARHDVPNPSLTPPHLLGAIYSIAFPFSMYDDKLCIDLAYDTLPYPALSRLINQGLAGELYSPSLAGVQTLLLLVARPSSNYLISDASYRWTTLGLLVASAVNLGLHLDPSNWNVKPWQVALRRRLSFIIYALDRWLAASLGRPPHIDQANWLVTSVEMTDNLDSGLSADQWVNMLDFSALTSVLTTTLSKLYSMRAVYALVRDPQETMNTVSDLLTELSRTSMATSSHRLDYTSNNSSFRTFTELGRHYIKLTILRASLRLYLPSSTNATNDTQESRDETRGNWRTKIASCQEEFSDFIRHMKSEDIIGPWPPWCQTAISSLCFSLLLMVVSSDSYDEATRRIEQLQSARRELRLKATSLPVLRLGLLRIDSIFWRGVDNVLRLEPHIQRAFSDSQTLPTGRTA